MKTVAALSLLLAACGATTRHQDVGAGAESTHEAGGSTQSGSGSAGVAGGAPASGLCPSLEQAPDSLLLVSRKGSERALIRADGTVHLRHTVPFDYAAE